MTGFQLRGIRPTRWGFSRSHAPVPSAPWLQPGREMFLKPMSDYGLCLIPSVAPHHPPEKARPCDQKSSGPQGWPRPDAGSQKGFCRGD